MSPRPLRSLVAAALVAWSSLALAGCGGDEAPKPQGDTATAGDSPDGTVDADLDGGVDASGSDGSADVPEDSEDAGSDGEGPDGSDGSDGGDGGDAADGATDCPGHAGCPCSDDASCPADSLCVMAQDGSKACAPSCATTESCTAGTCAVIAKAGAAGGKVHVCVDAAAAWCAPCKDNAACAQPGAAAAACVDRGAAGAYCGLGCSKDDECPSGSTCQDAKDIGGKAVKQCLPKDGAACSCSGWAKAKAAATLCYATGKPGCKAEIACSDKGLAACAPAAAQDEVCNGADDDCDGDTDNAAPCDDGTPCTADACDKGACVHVPADGACDDGDACTKGDSCASGACAPGAAVGCDDANPCSDDSCDKAKGCVALPNKATCDDADACTKDDACAVALCAGVTVSCDDGNPCSDDSCDKAKGCAHIDNSAPCDDGDACTAKDACAKGACAGSATSCDDANACTLDSCDKAKGCSNLKHLGSCDDGDACTTGDGCKDGKCAVAKAKCDDGSVCTADTCDKASGACAALPVQATTTCDDGDPCTTGDLCAAGKCGGKPKDCTAGACMTAVCQAGTCAQLPKVCDDGDACTADSCDAKTGACAHAAVADCGKAGLKAPLSEGFACDSAGAKLWTIKNEQETVGWAIDKTPAAQAPSSGKCSLNFNNGKDFVCPSGVTTLLGTVTSPAIDLSGLAKPAIFLHLGGTWEAGGTYDRFSVEVSGDGGKAWVDLGDVDGPATVGAWDDVTASLAAYAGKTVLLRLRFYTKDCTLNGGTGPHIDRLEVRDPAAGCTVDAQCFDGNVCTADACDKQAGSCTNKAQDKAACQDGDACTGVDTCDDKGVCKGSPAACDDSNPCTSDSCDGKTGKCQFAVKAGSCDDGNKCTVGDACNQGICITGAPASCDDGNACTTDACVAATGLCAYQSIAGCVSKCASDTDCGDADPCTIDSCQAGGACLHTAAADGAICGAAATCGKGKCAPLNLNGVVQIASSAAAYHTCARMADGSLRCWGYNTSGQLGDGTKTNATAPVEVKGIADAVDVAAGYYHTCAVLKDGTARCWGSNLYGGLGDGTTTSADAPVIVKDLGGLVSIHAGYYNTCARRVDGSVWCWGYNTYGQAGTGTTSNVLLPTRLNGISGVVALAAGYYHVAAVREDGTVWTWGYNSDYQVQPGSTTSVKEPTLRKELGQAVAVAAGYGHTCALSKSGAVRCVGDDSQGQRGDGSVTSVDDGNGAWVLGLANVPALGAGYQFNAALLVSGKVVGWGDNGNGQLGDGSTTDSPLVRPFQKIDGVIALATGRNHTCALRKDGQVWCSGDNYYGQLGDGTTTDANQAVRVHLGDCQADSDCADADACKVESCDGGSCKADLAKAGIACDDGDACTTADVCDANGVCLAKAKDCDDGNACTLLPTCLLGVCKQGFTIACDDANPCTSDACDVKTGACQHVAIAGCQEPCKADADCADASLCTVDSCVAGACAHKAGNDNLLCGGAAACSKGACATAQVAGQYASLSQGPAAYHTCAVRQDGKVVCWGYNNNGQLGDDSVTTSFQPVEAKGLADAVQVTAGYYHSCAIDTNGKLFCWGDNAYGQVGNDSSSDQKTPLANGLTGVQKVVAGYQHTCALRKDSSLWCWGYNTDGQVGDGTTTTRKAPVQVLGGVKDVALGHYHTAALLLDGSVWAWGQNLDGQTQPGTATTDVPSPTFRHKAPNAIGLVATGTATCARLGSGKVQCWGSDDEGELGNGAAAGAGGAIVDVVGLTGVAKLAGGVGHVIALSQSGEVFGWGANAAGQLGLASSADVLEPLAMPFAANIADVGVGRYHTCVLRNDGALFCTGDALYKQLGQDSTTDSFQLVHVQDGACTADSECNSGNACRVGTCDAQTGACAMTNAKAGAACNDGDACFLDDKCDDKGGCVGTAKDCEDGDLCTLAPSCKAGICTQTAKVDCDDLNPCTADSCDSKTGACSSKAIADCKVACDKDGDCNDGDPCTVDSCVNKVCAAKVGNDGGVCGAAAVCAAGKCAPLSKGWAVRLAAFSYGYHVCALHADGKASCWGRNIDGQLGNNSTTDGKVPGLVQELQGVQDMALGYGHTCAVVAGGKVACWGQNTYGQLGNGEASSTDVKLPAVIADFGDAVGVSGGYGHACAHKADGSVWCWGRNDSGQVGSGAIVSGTAGYVKAPSKVVDLSGVTALAGGYNHTCALRQDGSVWCWGDNFYAQLDGDPAAADSGKPKARAGFKKIRVLSAGSYHTCGVDVLGTGRCVGYNNYGQVGDGTTTTPVKQVFGLSGLGTLAGAAGGYYHSAFVDAGGKVWAVGYNSYGQLGNGTTTNSTAAVEMQGGAGAVQVVAYYHGSCVLFGDGNVKCAGYNTYGTVGNNSTTSASTLQQVVIPK